MNKEIDMVSPGASPSASLPVATGLPAGDALKPTPAGWFDLWPMACEYVHHLDDCAGYHSSDDKCTCGAVAFLDALANAPAPKRTVDLTRSEIVAISRQYGDA